MDSTLLVVAYYYEAYQELSSIYLWNLIEQDYVVFQHGLHVEDVVNSFSFAVLKSCQFAVDSWQEMGSGSLCSLYNKALISFDNTMFFPATPGPITANVKEERG